MLRPVYFTITSEKDTYLIQTTAVIHLGGRYFHSPYTGLLESEIVYLPAMESIPICLLLHYIYVMYVYIIIIIYFQVAISTTPNIPQHLSSTCGDTALFCMLPQNNTTIWYNFNGLSIRMRFLVMLYNIMIKLMLIYCSSDEAARVRLRYGQQPGSDYINASFIDVSNRLVSNKRLLFPMCH